MRDSPCHRCGDRRPYCHMTCARYAEYRKAVREGKTAAIEIGGYTCESYHRMRTRRARQPIRSEK